MMRRRRRRNHRPIHAPNLLLLDRTLLLTPQFRLRPIRIDILKRPPQQDRTRDRPTHPDPQENHTRHRTRILPIHERIIPAELFNESIPRRGVDVDEVRGAGREDDGVSERAGQREQNREHGADAPGEFHGGGLGAFGPEEVEEEGGAEDGGHVDADEDVVGGDADEVVVVDGGVGLFDGDVALLVDVVCAKGGLDRGVFGREDMGVGEVT